MSNLPRRHFLRRSALAATAAALVATTLPAETATELPVERVHQLARELALAMNDWCVDLGGLWVVVERNHSARGRALARPR